MTDQPTDPDASPSAAGSMPPPSEPAAEPARQPTFEERMERFGKEAGEAGERWGKRAEAAGQRWSKDPSIIRAADSAGVIWGLILLAVGLWFLADVTLGFDMPRIAWRDLWPIGLIGIGLLVLFRGMSRRA